MSDSIELIKELLLAAACGLLLGSIFFGGLWLTLKRSTRSKHPGMLLLTSMLVRLALVGGGLYYFADDQWLRYLAALPGILFARWWWIRHIEPKVSTV